MNSHDIELPQLPTIGGLQEAINRGPKYIGHLMQSYARAAVEDVRKRRGESAWIVSAVDAAMLEMKNIYPPLKRSLCERLIRAAFSAPQSVEKLKDRPTDVEKSNATVTLHFESAEAANRWYASASNEIALFECAEPVKARNKDWQRLALWLDRRRDQQAVTISGEVVGDIADLLQDLPCNNPEQCWEPCGALGNSQEHAKVYKTEGH